MLEREDELDRCVMDVKLRAARERIRTREERARRFGGPPPAERARTLLSAGHKPAADGRPVTPSEVQGLSVTRFAQLLALGVLGLAGLLALGVGGVVLVQGYAFPAPRIEGREHGPGRLRLLVQPRGRAAVLPDDVEPREDIDPVQYAKGLKATTTSFLITPGTGVSDGTTSPKQSNWGVFPGVWHGV